MTQHIFITSTGELHPHWTEAFPKALGKSRFRTHIPKQESAVVWVEWPTQLEERHYQELNDLVAMGKPVVVLSPMPNQIQAQTALSLGAKGYCHSYAVSKQLREIAIVVSNGGLWIGPDLVQKIMRGGQAADISLSSKVGKSTLSELTKKELVVAEAVAQGKTNKEIAQELEIGERTVKTHLSNVFQKLQVRDRVHLALFLNSIETSNS